MDPYGPYWEALELAPGAPLDEIKRAYREQALTWHPDRFPYDPALRQRCEERMRHVNAAYEALRELAEGGAPEPPERSPAWNAEPEPAAPPEEDAEAGWVERWLGRPRPAGAEASPPAVAAAPPPEWASLSRLGAALAAASAALGVLFLLQNPTWAPYWQGMRLVASPALAYAAAAAFARGVWEMSLGLGLLALALNPVLPVPMSLEDWRVFNAVTPPLLAGMWLWISKRG